MQILSVFIYAVMYLSVVTSVAHLTGFSTDLPVENIMKFMQNTYNTPVSANLVLMFERQLMMIYRTETWVTTQTKKRCSRQNHMSTTTACQSHATCATHAETFTYQTQQYGDWEGS